MIDYEPMKRTNNTTPTSVIKYGSNLETVETITQRLRTRPEAIWVTKSDSFQRDALVAGIVAIFAIDFESFFS